MILFFDLDDTLVDSELAHKLAIQKIYRENSFPSDMAEDSVVAIWLTITEHFLNLYYENKISLKQQRAFRIIDLWKNLGIEIDEEKALLIYQQYHYHFIHSCNLFPETRSVLEKLTGHHLGIISNGVYTDQITKLRNNQIDHFFKDCIISEKIGFSKPRKEIFDFAAQQVNAPLEKCIYIGNSYELDYIGSLNSGMKAIWLNYKRTEKHPDAENIYTLAELIDHPYLRE